MRAMHVVGMWLVIIRALNAVMGAVVHKILRVTILQYHNHNLSAKRYLEFLVENDLIICIHIPRLSPESMISM